MSELKSNGKPAGLGSRSVILRASAAAWRNAARHLTRVRQRSLADDLNHEGGRVAIRN